MIHNKELMKRMKKTMNKKININNWNIHSKCKIIHNAMKLKQRVK
jgi:hypothetical protein